ncbi:MAG: sulfite exporter TauE/SafE family protein [Rickettsiales bacterium]|nr:sulfite exporter TauE/SafE family protein [Rickettsiales bacterium]
MQSYNLTILISLINLGFFGGFTHCSGMCGPFVLTQVSNRLQNISLAQFSRFEKLRSMALLPYHCGRITTYICIGFFCSLITKNLQEIDGFNIISGLLLLFAAAFFLQNLFGRKIFKFNFRLPFHLPKIKNPSILKKLFQNPYGFNGFLLGIILGFIPCGLLYGAFALSASIANPMLAALGMFLFGIMTFPALFLTASGGYFFLKLTKVNFKLISKIIMLINAITLGVMGLELIIK